MTAIMRLFNTYLGPASSGQINLGHPDFRWQNTYTNTEFLYGDLVLTTDTGTRVGTSTTQRLCFYGTSAIVQPTNALTLPQALINLGLLAPGNYGLGGNLVTGSTLTISGTATVATLALTSGTNFVFHNDELMALRDDVVFV